MTTATAARLEQLVTETVWLRRLARSLVSDQATADDLVHDAYLVAAERPPPDDRPLRPWLARVMVNLARMRGRSAKRRVKRELRAEGAEDPARPDEIVEHLEMQRMLAGLVLELGDIYRDVLLLHFFDGLSSVEIGRRLGISDGTVRWRLKHALDELRVRLAERSGTDQRAWIGPMAGLAHGGGASESLGAAGGVFAMKKVVVAVVVIALALGALIVGRIVRDPPVEAAGVETAPTVASVAAPSKVPRWVVQAEAPARRIAGRVMRAGVPAKAVNVTLRAIAQPDVVIADVATAADGTFDLGQRPPADYHVIASVPDAPAAIADVSTRDPRSAPDRLVLVLGTCEWRLVGTVSDAARTPIASARVRLRGLVGVETDERGQFSLCRPPSTAPLLVVVSADGFGTVATTVSVRGTERRDFLLVPEGILVGRVVMPDGRTPVAGAQVMIAAVDRARTKFVASSTASDDEGRFQIGGLAPGRIALVARGDGVSSDVTETTIEAGTSKELLVAMHGTMRVRGRVVEGGTVVGSAEVSVVATNGNAGATTAWSQADGTFVLDGVPPGIVTWRVKGYAVTSPLTSTVAAETNVVLAVTREASVHGRVTQHGQPVADAVVRWYEGQRTEETLSDAAGNYDLVGVPAGKIGIAAVSEPLGAFGDREDVAIAAGSRTQLDLELDSYASVSGTVVDERGAPVREAYVTVEINSDWAGAMTDETGAFAAKGLSGGASYTVRVWPTVAMIKPYPAANPARDTRTLEAELPQIRIENAQSAVTGVVLAVRTATGSIRGRVVDDAGTVVADARVEVSEKRGRGSALISAAPAAVTDAAGEFLIDGIVAGELYLQARGADGSEVISGPLATGATGVVMTLPRAGSIEVALQGFGPAPRVVISDHGSAERDVVVDGSAYTFRGLRAGQYQVGVQEASAGDVRTVDVRPGASTRIQLVNKGTARLEATLVELGTNAPMAGVSCWVKLASGWPSPTDRDDVQLSDAAGRVAFTVPASNVRIICSPPGTAWANAQRELVAIPNKLVATRLVFVPIRPRGDGNPGFNVFTHLIPLTVGDVFPNAAKAGLAPGDHILSIDGVSLEGVGSPAAGALLLPHMKGSTIVLGIERKGVALTISIIAD